jgi:deazaflavin-dependent oxidoreductase (nitroreductase family)
VKGKPNAFQRLIYRIVMLRSVTAFFALAMHHLDTAALRLTSGKYTISEFAGWNIIQLRTIGAKTKRPRTLPLLALFDGNKIALIASNFGREHNPGWYYNLKANPHCQALFKGRLREYVARETEGEEREMYFQMAVSHYAGYQKYRERAAHRHIPVMVLEPKT